MLRFLRFISVLLLTAPALAATAVDTAFKNAIAAFERAAPQLGSESFGVDVAAYRNALRNRRFDSGFWGSAIRLDVVKGDTDEGSCSRFAAYVRIPPENGVIRLVICPEFIDRGNEGLRALTILHEMVHVVAGPDECRAMAFAAQVEFIATGQYTPVERYWQANGCGQSSYTLP